MQKSNSRFNKNRNSDKKPSFKSGPKKNDSKRTFSKDKNSEKSYRKNVSENDDSRSFKNKFSKPFERDKKPFGKRENRDNKFEKPYKRREGEEKKDFQEKSKFRKSFNDDKKPFHRNSGDNKKFKKSFRTGEEKPFKSKDFTERSNENIDSGIPEKHRGKKEFERGYKKTFKKQKNKENSNPVQNPMSKHEDDSIRLNKYLSNAGVCSRREADDLIKAGAVSVNGKIITEMGYRVMPTDKINYGGETLRNEKKIYLILNKPKDYLTTTDDPRERKTVMELIEGACRERVYPVGRLDRNTTGLLLFTNDGELATKLMHPKHGIKKLYHVLLNKNMKPADYGKLHEGVELEDGFIQPDNLSFTGESKKELGIEIHSGKNRIVRRIFEHLGYEVVKLDRVSFAGLTKKDLPRGKWRFLNPKEVGFLKMIG